MDYISNRAQQKRSGRALMGDRGLVLLATCVTAFAMAFTTLPDTASAASKSSRSRSAGSGLDEATSRLRSLQNDPLRQRFRHHWLPVIDSLEAAGQKEKAGRNAALAYMRAGIASRELAAISHLKSDYERAESYFVRVAECCSRETLADDALLAAAELNLEVLGRPEVARRQLQRAIAMKGDMRVKATTLLATLPPPPKPAPSTVSLDAATKAWHDLKADGRRRVYRDPWLEVISRLEAAAGEDGCRGRTALALMRAAVATEDLSRISGNPDDVRRAEQSYVRVANRCPDATLADDALLAAAILIEDRLSDIHAARSHLKRAIALKGDMAPQAQARLRSLPASSDVQDARSTSSQRELAMEAKSEKPDSNVETARFEQADEHDFPVNHASEAEALALERLIPDAADQLRNAVQMDDGPSLSEQVGLKVRRIIIDAGHGGSDPGAVGPTGLQEKEVNLAMALRLSALLTARGYETVLTRDSDTYLALEDRSAIANREKGDLFISIHANAHTKRTHSGIETYYLNVASDRFAMRLAARENASSERSISDLELLLADLATRANTVDSARLARSIQDSMVSHVTQNHGPVRDLGVKHALFYVLLGARMPAVLVETAFLSNPTEEKRLGSAKYQDTVAVAIADGIESFVARRVQLASADH